MTDEFVALAELADVEQRIEQQRSVIGILKDLDVGDTALQHALSTLASLQISRILAVDRLRYEQLTLGIGAAGADSNVPAR